MNNIRLLKSHNQNMCHCIDNRYLFTLIKKNQANVQPNYTQQWLMKPLRAMHQSRIRTKGVFIYTFVKQDYQIEMYR